jgi:hypothetical protein
MSVSGKPRENIKIWLWRDLNAYFRFWQYNEIGVEFWWLGVCARMCCEFWVAGRVVLLQQTRLCRPSQHVGSMEDGPPFAHYSIFGGVGREMLLGGSLKFVPARN